MGKIVVIDFDASVCEDFSEVVGWADKKVIAHHICDHLLVQVAVGYFFPIRILKVKAIC